MPTMSTERPMEWSKPFGLPMQQKNLTVIHDAILRGIAQAAKGEGTVIDVSALPCDNDH